MSPAFNRKSTIYKSQSRSSLPSVFNYPLANEVAKGYSNATVRPSFLSQKFINNFFMKIIIYWMGGFQSVLFWQVCHYGLWYPLWMKECFLSLLWLFFTSISICFWNDIWTFEIVPYKDGVKRSKSRNKEHKNSYEY